MTNNLFLNYITWNVDSDIFVIPMIEHPIRWYGICWLLGIVLCYRILLSIFKKEGRRIEFLDQLTIYIVLGILIAIYLFAKKQQLSFLWVADRVALVVPVAGACIRLGNLMNSEMIGTPSNLPWAFVFSHIDTVPRHPAQLYEAIFCILLFLLLYGLWKNNQLRSRNGNYFALLLILLFSFRFLDEFMKINQEHFEDSLFINMGQLLSIPFIIIGIGIFLLNQFKTSTQQLHS